MLKAIKVSGIIIAILVLLPFLVGCSSSKNNNTPTPTEIPTVMPTATPSTLSVEAAGAAYLEYVIPINAAQKAFSAKLSQWTDDTTSSQMEEDTQPYITACMEFNTKLQTTNWPSVAQADVRTLTNDIGQEVALLMTISTLNFLNVDTWLQSFANALNTVSVDVGWVRHDLGLPPAQ